jgi:hypothetical protein
VFPQVKVIVECLALCATARRQNTCHHYDWPAGLTERSLLSVCVLKQLHSDNGKQKRDLEMFVRRYLAVRPLAGKPAERRVAWTEPISCGTQAHQMGATK